MELAEASRRNLAVHNGVNDALMHCHSFADRDALNTKAGNAVIAYALPK